MESILNEQWIDHHFKITYVLPGTKKEIKEKLTKIREELLGFVLGQAASFKLFDIGKSVNISINEDNQYGVQKHVILIRFANISKKEMKEGKPIARNVKPKDEKEYLFSPKQSIEALDFLKAVGSLLRNLLKINSTRTQHWFHFKNKKPHVMEFSPIQFFSYPLEKRIKLFKEYPKEERKIFRGFKLKKWLRWVMEKENDDDHMKEYCQAVQKLKEKYGIK